MDKLNSLIQCGKAILEGMWLVLGHDINFHIESPIKRIKERLKIKGGTQ